MSITETTEVNCPACGSLQFAGEASLGSLGNLLHFRCKQCGGMWSVTDEEDESEL